MKIAIIEDNFFPIVKQHISLAKALLKDYDYVYFKITDCETSYHQKKMIQPLIKPYRHIQILDNKKFKQQSDSKVFKVNYCSLNWHNLEPLTINYLLDNELLLDKFIEQFHTPKRLIHVLSMSALAVQLANKHHLSTHKAYIAGMLHDVAKNWPKEELRRWTKVYYPQYSDEADNVLHQYAGAYFCHSKLHINDKDIIKAIAHHVKGDDQSPLSQVIYLADKLDPSRDYDSSKEIAVAMISLKQGMEVVKKQQEDYLRKEGVIR